MSKSISTVIVIIGLLIIVSASKQSSSDSDRRIAQQSAPPSLPVIHDEVTKSKDVPVEGQNKSQVDPSRKTEERTEPPKASKPPPQAAIKAEMRGHMGQAARIYSTAEQALPFVEEFLSTGLTETLAEFTGIQGDCSWCAELFQQLGDMIADTSTPEEERFRAAMLLSGTARVEAAEVLIEKAEQDPTFGVRTVLFESLARVPPTPEIIALYNQKLQDNDAEKIREALVAALGFGRSLEAAQALYRDITLHNDTDGFARDRIGLAYFNADANALPYIRSLVEKRDEFSPLAFRSLLNSGEEGLRTALDVLASEPNDTFWSDVIQNAPKYLRRIDMAKSNIDSLARERRLQGNAFQLAKVISDASI
jgi:hypothetical protein